MKGNEVIKNETGNALFLILIAVALFAALSYAVTQSGRSGGGVDKEQRILHVSRIFDYASLLNQSITRLKIIGNIADNEICFTHSNFSAGNKASYDLQATCADTSYHLFHTNGTAAPFMEIPTAWLDTSHAADQGYGEWMFTSGNSVTDIGTNPPGAGSSELIAHINHLSQEMCQAINDQLGITGIPDNGVQFSVTAPTQGPYAAGGKVNVAALNGQPMGCFDNQTIWQSYVFYTVLIVR